VVGLYAKILKSLTSNDDKLTLLRQVDNIKSLGINLGQLSAYAAALAILSEKSASLVRGGNPDSEVTLEKAISCLKSDLIKKKLETDEGSFVLLTEYLKL